MAGEAAGPRAVGPATGWRYRYASGACHQPASPSRFVSPGTEAHGVRYAYPYLCPFARRAFDLKGSGWEYSCFRGHRTRGRILAVVVKERRAKSLDDIPNSPTVRLTMDMETFSSLGCGRTQLDEVQANNGVRIEENRPLGQKILEEMNIMV